MCNIAHFLLTYLIDSYCLSILLFASCTVDWLTLLATGQMNFPKGMNKVSIYRTTLFPPSPRTDKLECSNGPCMITGSRHYYGTILRLQETKTLRHINTEQFCFKILQSGNSLDAINNVINIEHKRMMTYAHYSQIRTIYFCLCSFFGTSQSPVRCPWLSRLFWADTALIINGRWLVIKSASHCALCFILFMYFKTTCKHPQARGPCLLVNYLPP